MTQQDKIIVTGGKGTLGTQLRVFLPGAAYTDLDDFNISDYGQMKAFVEAGSYRTILHAAAFISPPVIEKEPLKAVEVNIVGTSNVVRLCAEQSMKIIYICTDYVFNGEKGNYCENDPVYPVNKYAWSKLGGECAVRMYDNHVIIRTSFGPNVFPYPKAFIDQWTSRMCVRDIAERIAFLAQQEVTGTFHIGGPRRTVYEYGKSLDPSKSIEPASIRDLTFTVPVDTSLDCSKFNSLNEKCKQKGSV